MVRLGRVLLAVALVVNADITRAALVINLNFDDTNAPADGSPILGGATRAQAQNVIQAAADYWTTAFAGSSSSASWASGGTITQNIDVTWGAQGNSTLATGGTSFFGNGSFAGGTLTFDNDGSSEFFVDPAPYDASPWIQSSTRSLTFNGVSMNVERVKFDAPAGVARTNSDMLTVAIHEIGHALGILSGYPGFLANVSSGNFTIGEPGPFQNAVIPVSGGHMTFQIQSPNTEFPYDASPGFFPLFDYFPNAIGPSILDGVRLGLTEVDIALVAETLQFDASTVNFNPVPVPEPASLLLAMSAGGGVLLWRRSRRRSV